VYSLVSAPVLGFDLTRLDGGVAVAEVLLRALAMTIDDLEVVALAGGEDWHRIDLWQDVDNAARARRDQAARAGTAGRADAAVDEFDLKGALAVLERTPLGTVDGLLHCLRHDVFDWTWRRHPAGLVQLKSAARSAGVLCDAAVAAYLSEVLPDETRRRLAAPWLTTARHVPERPVELGPQGPAVRAFVDQVRGLGADDVRRLLAVNVQGRAIQGRAVQGRAIQGRAIQGLAGIADWASAVHSATWAVFVTGRVRAAAAAQLLLVQAIDAARIPVPDRAGGCWNLLSGAVQALAVRDVLDESTLYRLTDPVATALAPIAAD
jgi:hypothetical protein